MKCTASSTPRFNEQYVVFVKVGTSLSSAAKTEPCSLDKKSNIFVFEPAKLVKNCSLEARGSELEGV